MFEISPRRLVIFTMANGDVPIKDPTPKAQLRDFDRNSLPELRRSEFRLGLWTHSCCGKPSRKLGADHSTEVFASQARGG